MAIPYLYEDPNITSLGDDSSYSHEGILSVFNESSNLEKITLTKQTLLSHSQFKYCTNLKYVKIESNATDLGDFFVYINVEIVILPNII